MTTRERAAKVLEGLALEIGDTAGPLLLRRIAAAIEEAVKEEREAACRETCWWCREGWPFDNGNDDNVPPFTWHKHPEYKDWHSCLAAAIRRRGTP